MPGGRGSGTVEGGKEVSHMAAISQQPRSAARVAARQMWVSLAISVMWIVVLLDALFGPDFVTNSATSSTTIPSAIFVAVFAWLGTRVVAKYGFADRDEP
jgi:hypothetical protein